MTPHRRYEELWRELQLCDELGFDYGFCVEHHFRPDESWISSSHRDGSDARRKSHNRSRAHRITAARAIALHNADGASFRVWPRYGKNVRTSRYLPSVRGGFKPRPLSEI